MELDKICQICFELIKTESYLIRFDCSHTICLKCYPYIAFNLLSKSNFSLNCRLLDSFEEKYSCPLCKKGKALQESSENYSNFLKIKESIISESQKQSICNLCKKKAAIKFCQKCHKNEEGIMCRECAVTFHSYASRKDHYLIAIEEYLQKQKTYGCSCQKKNVVEFYCSHCSSFFCKDCFKKLSKEHQLQEILEIKTKIENVPQNLLENSTNALKESFKNKKNNLFRSIKTIIADEEKLFLNEIEELIHKLIKFLELLKKQRQQNIYYEILKIKKQFNLIDTSLSLFSRYASRESNNFREKYQILKCFSKSSDPEGIDKEIIKNLEFSLDSAFISEIKARIKEKIADKNQIYWEEVQEITRKLESLFEKTPIDTSKFEEAEFNSSPLQIVQKAPFELEKGSFTSWNLKSSLSCAFNIDNETYLAWSGYEENSESFPLVIYNLSTKKRCHSIKFNPLSSHLQVVSTFPKIDNESTQKTKWLYAANRKGTVKCFDISDNKFLELSTFQTDAGSDVVAFVIFQDKHKEVDGNSCCIYAIASFQNNKIMMYRFLNSNEKHLKGSWEKFKKINGLGKICYTIGSFCDDLRSRTYLFFGFFELPIGIYKIKENSWEKPLDNNKNSIILSINFIFIQNPQGYDKRYLIYTQCDCNLITICDIDMGNIVQQIVIPNSHSVMDLLVWNDLANTHKQHNIRNCQEIYLIVASRETYCENTKGSLHILSLDKDLIWVLRKSLINEISPINLIKTKASFGIDGTNMSKIKNEKKALVALYGYGPSSKIVIYGNELLERNNSSNVIN